MCRDTRQDDCIGAVKRPFSCFQAGFLLLNSGVAAHGSGLGLMVFALSFLSDMRMNVSEKMRKKEEGGGKDFNRCSHRIFPCTDGSHPRRLRQLRNL